MGHFLVLSLTDVKWNNQKADEKYVCKMNKMTRLVFINEIATKPEKIESGVA